MCVVSVVVACGVVCGVCISVSVAVVCLHVCSVCVRGARVVYVCVV